MWYLLWDYFWVQRVNVFVFACQVHCTNSDLMNIRIFQNLITLLHSKVCIENRYCEEVSSSRALERSCDFNHPVDHFSAILLAYIMLLQRRFSNHWVSLHEIFVYFLEKSQLKVFLFFRGRLLCAHETLLSLLACSNRPSISSPCHIFDSNNVLLHWIYDFALFLIISRSGRNGTSCLSCTFGHLMIFSTGCSIYSEDLTITTLLSSHCHILNRTAVFHVLVQFWRFSSYIQTRGHSSRCLHHHLLLKLWWLLVHFLGRCV